MNIEIFVEKREIFREMTGRNLSKTNEKTEKKNKSNNKEGIT